MAEKQNRYEMFRRLDEPHLEVGQTVNDDGVICVVLCRYRKTDPKMDVYVVEPKRLSVR